MLPQLKILKVYIRQILIAIKREIDSYTITVYNSSYSNNNSHLHQWTEYPERKSIRKYRPDDTLDGMYKLILIKHSIQKQQNAQSFQVHVKRSPGQVS